MFNSVQQEFYIPVEAYDVIFLTTKIAILCKKRFEVMDLSESVAIALPLSRWLTYGLQFYYRHYPAI